jgi:DNA-binding transcriptional ArsR family regulator
MREFLNITKALGDKNRVRVLLALQGRELCVCQITELLGLAMSTISKHLSILYQAGLVNSRKEGRWMYYCLPGRGSPAVVREAVGLVKRSLEKDDQARKDTTRLEQVLKMDPVELCKRQCGK